MNKGQKKEQAKNILWIAIESGGLKWNSTAKIKGARTLAKKELQIITEKL